MATKPRKRRKVPKEELINYVMRIEAWDMIYGFGRSGSRLREGPYNDLHVLQLSGSLIESPNPKYTRAVLDVTGSTEELKRWEDEDVISVGFLSANEDLLHVYWQVPTEHMPTIVTLSSTGRLNHAQMMGTKLRYRQGLLRWCELHTKAYE